MCPAEFDNGNGGSFELGEGNQGLFTLPDKSQVLIIGRREGFEIIGTRDALGETRLHHLPFPKTYFYRGEILQLADHAVLMGD